MLVALFTNRLLDWSFDSLMAVRYRCVHLLRRDVKHHQTMMVYLLSTLAVPLIYLVADVSK